MKSTTNTVFHFEYLEEIEKIEKKINFDDMLNQLEQDVDLESQTDFNDPAGDPVGTANHYNKLIKEKGFENQKVVLMNAIVMYNDTDPEKEIEDRAKFVNNLNLDAVQISQLLAMNKKDLGFDNKTYSKSFDDAIVLLKSKLEKLPAK